MNKFNVKHTTNTNLMTDILTTKCVRIDTAISRFCRFLNDYDTSFKDSLLVASMNVNPSGYNDGVPSYKAVTETDDYYLTLKGCNGIWTVTIEFKYDKNTVHYRSISNPEFLEAEQTSEQEETSEQSEAEQTSEQEETSEQSEAEQTAEHNKEHILRAYENGKELNVPCSRFNKREYAINYINKLYENGVVNRDVVFTINNSYIYDCFSDVKLTGPTALTKYATFILNTFYTQLCNDIAFVYKMRICDDIDAESKNYYGNLSVYVTILKKVLNGFNAKMALARIIKHIDTFEVCGNVCRTAMKFIFSYNENKTDEGIKRLENKIRNELL